MNKLKKYRIELLLFLLVLFNCFIVSHAQAATYAYRNDNFTYDTPSASANVVVWHSGNTGSTNGSPACTSYPLGDDDWSDIVFANSTSPTNTFTFTFAGVSYNGLRIYSNGMMVFGNDTSGQWRTYSNVTLPDNNALGTFTTGCSGGLLNNAIIPYWTDIVADAGGGASGASIKYELLGTAPNRRLIISWVNVQLYGQSNRYNFQVSLYESPAGGLNSNFKFQYTTGSSTGSSATVGVQVSTSDYTLYSFNQAFIDPTVGSAILWYPANQLAGKGAEYRFDESTWNGTAGEVKDTSGNNQNAVRVGLAANVTSGKVCHGGSFTSNISNTVIDAINTPINPASVGSADFWFYSKANWNSLDAMLLDATSVSSKPFFLMKTAAGALKLAVTDSAGTVMTLMSSAQNFSLNTWHHVGISWNLKPGTNQTLLQIFIDGSLNTTLRFTSSGVIYPSSLLVIGDNAVSGLTPAGGSPNGANGVLDELNIYGTEISAPQVASDMNSTHTCVSVDHFHVIHNGTSATCETTPITIEAHDINHALVALSGVTLSLSASPAHGNWSNVSGGSVNTLSNNGNGASTYVFSNESKVTFGLQDPASVAESLIISATSGTVNTSSGAASVCSASDFSFGNTCNTPLSFLMAGFIFSNAGGGSIASIPSQVAGVSSGTYYLRAVTSNTTTKACVAAITGAASVNFGYVCNNPAVCSPSNLMSVNGGTSTIISRNNNGSVSSYSGVNMNFDSNGNAPFTFNYGDVGQVTLYANKAAGGTLPSALSGASNALVVAPASFAINGITASPIKAGNSFNATVTAMTGTNAPALNFGNENSKEGVTLSANKYQPTGVGAVNGTFSGTVSSFLNGSATGTNLNWTEVGTLDITASLTSGSYIGSGLTANGSTGSTGLAGRFIPDHFDTVATPGCSVGSYTYSAQPFTTQVIARNLVGNKTLNYDGSINTAPNFSKVATLSDTNAVSGGSLSPNVIASTAFLAGVAAVTPSFTFTSPASSPATIRIHAVDTDNVMSAINEGTANILSGRLRFQNAYGSELLNLPVPLEAQYWNGSAYVRNQADNCTSIAASSIAMANYRNNLAACKTQIGYSIGTGVFTNGVSKYLRLTRPGAGNNGSVDLTINLNSVSGSTCNSATGSPATSANLPWFGMSPVSRDIFGIYKTPVIYLRENF